MYPSEGMISDWNEHNDHADGATDDHDGEPDADGPPDNHVQHRCPDCGVARGRRHAPNCDVARCGMTGGQRFCCPYADDKDHDCGSDIWTGVWPVNGVQAFRDRQEFGSIARPGFIAPDLLARCTGDQSCPVHPGAMPHVGGELFPVARDPALDTVSRAEHLAALARVRADGRRAHAMVCRVIRQAAQEWLDAGNIPEVMLRLVMRTLEAEENIVAAELDQP